MRIQIRLHLQGQSEPGEQSELDLHCLLKRLYDISTDDKTICAFRVNKCEFRVYGHDYHEMRTRLRAQATYHFFNQIINKT